MNGKVKKSKLQGDIKTILANNYGSVPVGPTPVAPNGENPLYIKEEEQKPKMVPEKKIEAEEPKEHREHKEQKISSSSAGGDPKEQLNNFFSQSRS